MLGINCLVKNPQIQKNLRDLVELTGYQLVAKNGSAKLNTVYETLRKSGIEVDIQTLGTLYEDIFDTTDGAFNTSKEVSEAMQSTYKKLANKTAQQQAKTIGRDKPSVAVASELVNSLIKNIPDPSQQKIFQDRLAKAAKRILGIKNTATKTDVKSLMEQVLSTERSNDFNGMGVMENAQTLFTELGNELASEGATYSNAQLQQWGKILQTTTLDFLASQGEIKSMVDGVLKEEGYTKKVKVNGQTTDAIDWDKIIASNVDFKAALSSFFIKRGISTQNAQALTNGLATQYNQILSDKIQKKLADKNKPTGDTKEQRAAIEKLVELYNLGGIANNATQTALAKIAGISDLEQSQVNQLTSILSTYKSALQNPIAQWSPAFTRTLERQIESLISSIDNKDKAVNLMSKLSSFMQFNNAIILSNPQNIAENTISGFIEGFVVTAINNPRSFLKGFTDFGNKWLDFAKGGVRVGEEKSNVFNTGGNIEDLYSVENRGWNFGSIASVIPRIVLGAADNGIKHQITQSLIEKSLRNYLVKSGATSQEANLILNKIYYGNNAEIEALARKMSGDLTTAGVKTKSTTAGGLNAKEKVIASELALANMMTEGKFFQDTLNKLIADGSISTGLNTLNIDEGILRDIREAAYSTAGKGLGHEADNEILKLFETRFDKLNKSIEEAKKEKHVGQYIGMQSLKLFMSGINRFRGGSFNWLFLGLQKTTGLALAQTLLTDVLFRTGNAPLRFSKIDFSNEQTRQDQLARYLALRQRLVREIVPTVFSYAVAGAALSYIKGGGDDEEKKNRLRQFKEYLENHPGAKRWFNKIAPQTLYTYMENINSTPLNKFPTMDDSDIRKLNANGINELNLQNMPTVKTILNLTDKQNQAVIDRITTLNSEELPTLFSMWYNPANTWTGIKNIAQPNPLIQAGLDLVDVKKPDKGAVMGQFGGNVANPLAILKSVDIWKNSIQNKPKIEGEYKIIKAEGFAEGAMYSMLNKDLYKKLFVGAEKLKLNPVDLPGIGDASMKKLHNAEITDITPENIDQVVEVLWTTEAAREKHKADILEHIATFNEKIKKIKE